MAGLYGATVGDGNMEKNICLETISGKNVFVLLPLNIETNFNELNSIVNVFKIL